MQIRISCVEDSGKGLVSEQNRILVQSLSLGDSEINSEGRFKIGRQPEIKSGVRFKSDII